MRRDVIDFETFKKNFIEQPDGLFSVYAAFEEDYHGEALRVLKLDMICEWRMTDGKVKFVEVPFDTEEQFDLLVAYLCTTADMLHRAIRERIGELTWAETKPKSEAIPYPPSSIPTLPDAILEEIKRKAMGYEMRLFSEALEAQRDAQEYCACSYPGTDSVTAKNGTCADCGKPVNTGMG